MEQSALIERCNLHSADHPELLLIFAIPNGGLRSPITAQKLIDEGVKAGVPDLFLPVARHGYHGLFLEMKSKKGRLSDNQKRWIVELERQGYVCVIPKGREAAWQALCWYLDIKC